MINPATTEILMHSLTDNPYIVRWVSILSIHLEETTCYPLPPVVLPQKTIGNTSLQDLRTSWNSEFGLHLWKQDLFILIHSQTNIGSKFILEMSDKSQIYSPLCITI